MPITLDGTNGITTPTYGGADTSEYLVPVTQFKNRLINSAMVIDQRNAGASVTANDGVFPVDRFRFYMAQNSKATSQQSTTAPTGFINSLLVTSSSAYSVLTGDYFNIAQIIEGLNCTDLGWGTANAKTVTLSFWVRSSLTGTFGGSLNNSANDRSYPFSYTISSANTWEQKTVTVAGDTSGTWLTTNGIGIRVFFSLGAGSTYLGSSSAWGSTDYRGGLTGATSVVGTNGATFYITGVQLEVGSTATSFDVRPYGTELALCQRYYYKEFPAATGYVLSQGSGAVSTTAIKATGKFPVTLRTKPSALQQSGTANQYQVVVAGTATTCSAVPTHDGATNEENWICNATVSSGLTTGQAGYLRTDSTNGATAYLAWSAEL